MSLKIQKSEKLVWFENSIQINCSIKNVKDSVKNIGKLFTDITKLMPGINM